MHSRQKYFQRSTLLFTLLIFCLANATIAQDLRSKSDRATMAEEMRTYLQEYAVGPWYPRIIDEDQGGFLSDFDADWKAFGDQEKMIVTQSRHVWSPSRLHRFYRELGHYDEVADHGADFLKNKMWDWQHGGFYQQVSRAGDPVSNHEEHGLIKTGYGNAFGIYGLSAFNRISGNKASLELAKKAFMWLEENSHDAKYGGYFQFMREDGTAFREGLNDPPKDQNSSIHLLEAFCELYHVWPDPLVRKRIEELMVLIRDTITTDKGHMNLFFDQAWQPISFRDSSESKREEGYRWDHVSFGHDIETAYLLREASETIYHEVDPVTAKKAKRMVDHTIQWGWDKENAGLLDRGYYFKGSDQCEIIEDAKVWWAQVEAMNTLLIMADLYPEDPMQYDKLFVRQWDYIKNNLVDHERKGIYSAGLDTKPESKEGRKASIWKGNYHTVRSMVNCIERLEAKD